MSRRARSKRHLGLVALLAATALALTACFGGGATRTSAEKGPTGTLVDGGTVSYGLGVSGANWIFPMMQLQYFTTTNEIVTTQMYRPLYWFGGNNLSTTINYPLSVARPPVYAPDGRSVTISLRRWRWSNGEPVSADDVVFWMNMVKAERKNWAAYTAGAFPDNISSVTKLDDHTVRLGLDDRYSEYWYTYNELSQITPMPMAWDVTHLGAQPGSGGCTRDPSRCRAVYDFLVAQAKDQQGYATSKIWGVVDGPWRLSSYTPSGPFTLVPNKAYSGSPKPRLAAVNYLTSTSDSAEFNLLRSGSLDIGSIPPQDLPAKPIDALVPTTNPLGSRYYLRPGYAWAFNFNTVNYNNPTLGAAFRQLYIRQALQLTLDQPLDVAKAQRGYGYPQYNPVPVEPPNPWVSPATKGGGPYPFSPKRAKALLLSHGWTEQNGVMTCTRPGTGAGECGRDIPRGRMLKMTYLYGIGAQALDQEMQQYKSDAAKAGIELDLKGLAYSALFAMAGPCTPTEAQCRWQAAGGGGWGYVPDYLPSGELLFASHGGSNGLNYYDARMDHLIQATEHDSGTQPLYDYEDYAMRTLPVTFMPGWINITAISAHVGGVVNNPLGLLTPEYWYRTR
jgi:peptide/nickel transport system substrate-binding protein